MAKLKLVSGSKQSISFNGVSYEFAPGEVVEVPDEAAEHIIRSSHVTSVVPDEHGIISDRPAIAVVEEEAEAEVVAEVPPSDVPPDVPPVDEVPPVVSEEHHDAQ